MKLLSGSVLALSRRISKNRGSFGYPRSSPLCILERKINLLRRRRKNFDYGQNIKISLLFSWQEYTDRRVLRYFSG